MMEVTTTTRCRLKERRRMCNEADRASIDDATRGDRRLACARQQGSMGVFRQSSASLLMLLAVIAATAYRPFATTVDGFLTPSLSCKISPRTDGQRTHTNHHSILSAKSGKKKKKPTGNTVAVNRIAYRNYEIIDTLEAGISLLGTEVKSIRDGKLNLRDGYVRPSKNGRSCVLHNVHVGKCSQVGAEYFQHEEKRPRVLLVHKAEARKFLQQTEQQGMTVIPLKAYWNDANKLKVQIALCRGKNVRDKRATIQERDAKRETNRIIKNFRIV